MGVKYPKPAYRQYSLVNPILEYPTQQTCLIEHDIFTAWVPDVSIGMMQIDN